MYGVVGYGQHSATRGDVVTAYRLPGTGEESSPGPEARPTRWGVILLCLLLMGPLVTAGLVYSAAASGPRVDVAPDAPALLIEVNYAHNWVSGYTAPDSSVRIAVLDSGGVVKDETRITAQGDGSFITDDGGWSAGMRPDMAPGDAVEAENLDTGATAVIEQVGEIRVSMLNEDTDRVEATLLAPWFTDPLTVLCEVWLESGTGPDPIHVYVDPDGGSVVCDWTSVGWDLQRGQMVALRYFEPDGDNVINVPVWPWMRVNAGHNTAGANADVGTVYTVEVRDSGGTLKATASAESEPWAGWGGDGFDVEPHEWLPSEPDILPGDRVIFATGTQSTTLAVGTISGVLDVAADSVSGTVTALEIAPDPGSTVTVECHPWGAWDAGIADAPVKVSSAAVDGSTSYSCSWDPLTEWDVQPGQAIGVMYLEPDQDRVIDVFALPAARLLLGAGSDSIAAPGGNVRLWLEVRNEGDSVADDVTVRAAQSAGTGLQYLSDTSGIAPVADAGTLLWELGTLTPGDRVAFEVYYGAQGAAGDMLSVSLTAETSSFSASEVGERTHTQQWTLAANDTQLNIGKWAALGRPAAGQPLEYGVAVCNSGSTSSGAFTVTDTPGPGQSLIRWSGDEPGWTEVAFGPDGGTWEFPALEPGGCVTIRPVAMLAADLPVLSPISNTATLTGGNDLTPDDNVAYWEAPVSVPWMNLTVAKTLSGGRLVPGGVLRYEIVVRNEGNIASGPINIEDTLPLGTSFAKSWESSFWGTTPFPPYLIGPSQVSWEIPGLDPGREFNMGVMLTIDTDATPGTVLVNTVEVTTADPELRYDDNLAEPAVLLNASGPNLALTKTATWWDAEHIHYDVLLDNLGSVIVSGVPFTDTLPVGTTYAGDLALSLEPERIQAIKVITGTLHDTLIVELTELYPGERIWMGYSVSVDDPDSGLTYTNVAETMLPAGDVNPADNSYSTVSVPPSPLQWVETWVNDRGPSRITGGAIPGTEIVVTTPSGTFNAWADPACGGCWAVEDLGELAPGDALTLAAGAGAYPLSLVVPDPFTALADSATDEVTGQVGGRLAYRLVEIHGDWGGNGMAWTGADGSYLAGLDDIPQGATGVMRVEEGKAAVWVVWARPLSSLDLLLEVNYGHDWVNVPYELGHTAAFTVAESDGKTDIATANVTSQVVPGWGGWTGFTTILGDPWAPEQPDLEPGDWVYGEVDNGSEAQVQLGEIAGLLDLAGDSVAGTISLPGAFEAAAWCAVWVDGGPEIWFDLPTGGADFTGDLGAAGWDLRPGQDVAVGYVDPMGHRVINVFREGGYTVFLPLVTR